MGNSTGVMKREERRYEGEGRARGERRAKGDWRTEEEKIKRRDTEEETERSFKLLHMITFTRETHKRTEKLF